MILRWVWRETYAHASHLAVAGVAIWATYLFSVIRSGNLEFWPLILAGAVSTVTSLLAIARLGYEGRIEWARQRQHAAAATRAAQEAEWMRRVSEQGNRRRAYRASLADRREREHAEAPTEPLPIWPTPRTVVYKVIGPSAEAEESQRRLMLELFDVTGDVVA